MKSPEASPYIKWFREIGMNDIASVGGKNASLGELYQNLSPRGILVPNGFAITAGAYYDFLKENKLDAKIEKVVANLDTQDSQSLQTCGRQIREFILAAKIPMEMEAEIISAYQGLGNGKIPPDVAVRSSATAEDLPSASFAGQQETFLNVQGEAELLAACLACFASLYTDRALSYRFDKGFTKMKIGLSVGVQQMVRSDLAASGVMFSIDTETGFRDLVVINSSYGLGENIVQGAVNPDEYYVFKPTLKTGFKPILQKEIGNQRV